MKTLIPLTIFLRSTKSPPSPSLLLFFSTESHPRKRPLSSSSSSETPQSFSTTPQTHDLSRNVRVSVWWDLENCGIPSGVSAFKIARNIVSAVRVSGIRGPVTITAFGDFIQVPRATQEALSCTGVLLNHVPNGGMGNAHMSLLADLVFWASQNPPPEHLFLISGDKDAANILHRLRMNNYNILLASKYPAPGVLCSAASIMWSWCDLARGEDFRGKHFNEPPDGPLGSWYIHKSEPLEDPLADPTPCVEAEDLSDVVQVPKQCAIPKTVVNQICEVVNSYPKGVDISDLRAELLKSNVPIDKEFFGYKKFSLLLKSLPTVLKLQSHDAQIIVHGIQSKVTEPSGKPKVEPVVGPPKVAEPVGQPKDAKPIGQTIAEPVCQPKIVGGLDHPKSGESDVSKLRVSTDSDANDVHRSRTTTAELNGSKNVVPVAVNEKSSLPPDSPPKVDSPKVSPTEKVHPMDDNLPPIKQNDSISEAGFFRRVWRTVLGHNSDASKEKSKNSAEICLGSVDRCEEEKCHENSLPSSVSSSNLNNSVLEGKPQTTSEEKDETRTGMFGKIKKWWTGKSNTSPDNSIGQLGEAPNLMDNQTHNSQLFNMASFWDELLSFLQSPKGASLISRSKTREEMSQQLQTEGPPHLSTLAKDDLTHLVDLLISEKKWVGESTSRTFPFKLIYPARASSSSFQHRSSTGLSSLFGGQVSLSNSREPSGLERENAKNKDSRPGASSDENNRKLPGKPPKDIIADCQKLVTEKLKEQPEGFHLSVFKALFLERYGYDLDHQKLGYLKLGYLLETLPGVVVHLNAVLPREKPSSVVIPYDIQRTDSGSVKTRKSVSEVSWPTLKGGDNDKKEPESTPMSNSKKKYVSRVGEETKEGTERADFDDNIYFSEDDSEGDCPIKDGSDGVKATRNSDFGNSIIELLGTPYNKDIKSNREWSNDADGFVDVKPSSSPNNGRKRPRKNFSFISEGNDKLDEKRKLVDGILGCMKKSNTNA